MKNDLDETRQYEDMDGVVHRSSDTYGNTRITYCERYERDDTYDSRALAQVTAPITCVVCLTLSGKLQFSDKLLRGVRYDDPLRR